MRACCIHPVLVHTSNQHANQLTTPFPVPRPAAPLHAQIVTLAAVHSSLDAAAKPPLGGALLQHLLPHLVAEYGPQFVRDLWSNEQLSVEQFVPAAEAEAFIAERQLQWLADPKAAAPTTPAAQQPSAEKVQQRIKELLLAETRSDAIFDYVSVSGINNR